mmetsp:Transcript_2857/g.8589  ORF Transcript_2857/g.8589 Transcript_2857/m.8589 type:complete len:208 (+) Transcript_2857:459-1082(+)
MGRPRSAVDPREVRAASHSLHQRRGRSRTTVDMADVWVALEMQRLRQQSAMLATTPPGSRSSFGSLASLSSSASSGSLAALPITVGAGAVLPPAPPPYASRHRKVINSPPQPPASSPSFSLDFLLCSTRADAGTLPNGLASCAANALLRWSTRRRRICSRHHRALEARCRSAATSGAGCPPRQPRELRAAATGPEDLRARTCNSCGS